MAAAMLRTMRGGGIFRSFNTLIPSTSSSHHMMRRIPHIIPSASYSTLSAPRILSTRTPISTSLHGSQIMPSSTFTSTSSHILSRITTHTPITLVLRRHMAAVRTPSGSSRARGKQHVPPPRQSSTSNSSYDDPQSDSLNWSVVAQYTLIIAGVYGAFLIYSAYNPTTPSVVTVNILGRDLPLYTVAIIAVNLGVFAAWRIPSLAAKMSRYFTCTTFGTFNSRRWETLFLAAFSHAGPYHFAFNMMALYSIAPMVNYVLGDRQFLSLYMAIAGLSSIGGLVGSWLIATPATAAIAAFMPSLGASGVVCALFAIYSQINPTAQFMIIILPFWPMDATTMLKGLVGFDIAGCIYQRLFGSSGLGHTAHLSGTGLGYAYYHGYAKHFHPNIIRLEQRHRLTRGS